MELIFVFKCLVVAVVIFFMFNSDTVSEFFRNYRFDKQFKCPADVVKYAIEHGVYNHQLYMCFVVQGLRISTRKKQQVYNMIDDSLGGDLSLNSYLVRKGVVNYQEMIDRKKEFWHDWVNNPKHNVPFK